MPGIAAPLFPPSLSATLAIADTEHADDSHLRSLFHLLDHDHDSQITDDDLRSLMHALDSLVCDPRCPSPHSNSDSVDNAICRSEHSQSSTASKSLNALKLSSSFTSRDFVEKWRRLKSAESMDSSRSETIEESSVESASAAYHNNRHEQFFLDFDDFTRLYESLMSEPSTATASETEEKEEDVEAAFKVYDTDGNGFICAAELSSVLRTLGLLSTADANVTYCQTLIDCFDTNGDGVVDLNEFRAMLRTMPCDHPPPNKP